MTALAYLRSERTSAQLTQARMQEAQARARQAVEKAKQAVRLSVQMAASAVNDELDHVANAQAVARAVILPDDLESTITTIEQYMDDLLFQPLQLLAREAGDQ